MRWLSALAPNPGFCDCGIHRRRGSGTRAIGVLDDFATVAPSKRRITRVGRRSLLRQRHRSLCWVPSYGEKMRVKKDAYTPLGHFRLKSHGKIIKAAKVV